jgi:hypothetical protein
VPGTSKPSLRARKVVFVLSGPYGRASLWGMCEGRVRKSDAPLLVSALIRRALEHWIATEATSSIDAVIVAGYKKMPPEEIGRLARPPQVCAASADERPELLRTVALSSVLCSFVRATLSAQQPQVSRHLA